MKTLWKISALTLAIATFGTGATFAADDKAVQAAISRLAKGYLDPKTVPDAALFLPPPPAKKSGAEARDKEAQKAALALQGGPRWKLATDDADIFTPKATGAMSCAAGFEISPEATPKLDALLRRTMTDFALSTRTAKAKYQRARPFMVNKKPNCTPDWDKTLRGDGSYPSGHSTIGFGWSLIVAELVPERAALLSARGRAFADSRRVCNVHWLSDTQEGAFAAPAVLARLHAEAAFRADLDAVRTELADPAVRSRAPSRDCAGEAAAMAMQ
jgi:acid phosphatase (class A)